MKHIVPTQIERKIEPNQFIVSKTDLKGNITYCNETFMNIVGAKEEELLGHPHSIIRHPDMPKTIFKKLWTELKAKREVFAFVKNLCFDGSYYWVFANVTPSFDENGEVIGYYSVRRQMNDSLIPTFEDVYSKILLTEQSMNVEAGMQYLATFLDEQGMDYNKFISHIAKSKD
jgi:PAS domain S-box-containing protein